MEDAARVTTDPEEEESKSLEPKIELESPMILFTGPLCHITPQAGVIYYHRPDNNRHPFLTRHVHFHELLLCDFLGALRLSLSLSLCRF